MKVIRQIEQILSSFYGFTMQVRAEEHLTILSTDNKTMRGQVLYCAENDETTFLGLEIREDILLQLEANDPFVKLSLENIDAFSVLVEELSHFHLLANRIMSGQEVRSIELEWQAEVDKLLLASALLYRQTRSNHFFELAHLIYEKPIYISEDSVLSRYQDATKLAARFWYDQGLRSIDDPMNATLTELRRLYLEAWPSKVALIAA